MTAPQALRALIVDDEALARLRLRSLLQDAAEPAVQVLGEAADADQALAWLQAHEADLVLLDIRMPGRDGMQLAAALRSLPAPPCVVFVTAHGNHALRAFDLDAVDYLTKPVQRDRLQAALRRVLQRRWPIESQPVPLQDEPVLVVSDRGRVLRVPVAEVLVLKAELKYVTLRTAGASHLLDDSLTDLERRLGKGFIRIHRNALVAARAVRELRRRADGGAEDAWAVRVAPLDEWLPVSRRQLAAVRESLAAAR
ncbi:MAG: response regulator transcription factor [Rubrivivax sp.]|nr:response regulator transcription factor [Rubrivivax sp.]MBK7261569.1 response regulator transcription factor [Rubrivivax sp.]MBK8529369.1 response regulator transcription factor [Rubrivivax sp.]